MRLLQRENRINELNKMESIEQVVFKHLISQIDQGKNKEYAGGNKLGFSLEFLSTVALTASKRNLDSPTKPLTASTYLRRPDLSRTNSIIIKSKKPFFLSS